jgi:hypothetical protein
MNAPRVLRRSREERHLFRRESVLCKLDRFTSVEHGLTVPTNPHSPVGHFVRPDLKAGLIKGFSPVVEPSVERVERTTGYP